MKVVDLMHLLEAENLTKEVSLEGEVTCGYSCDLLSWVLAHGKQGMGWATVQSHVNVIAVSVLMEMACVILVEGVEPEDATLAKALEEGMPILSTEKTAYEVCGIMCKAGVAVPGR
ncbi:MAG: AraC family transcriptional regulator [Clostridia bacterium]|nr:AraC family transcriptional regulator [Clostridia bacterium]